MSGMEKAMDGAAAPLDRAARERLRGLCEAATRAPWRVNVVGGPDGRAVGDDWMIGSFGEAEVDGKYRAVHVTTDRVRASEHGGSDAMDDARLIAEGRNALPSLLTALDAAEARAERAEAFPSRCAFCSARTEANPRAAAEHIATCDKHPLRAAVEECVSLRAERDDMRAQRDHNANTAVRSQAGWREALVALTPPGLTWPEPKPTEIATLTEASAAIAAALRAEVEGLRARLAAWDDAEACAKEIVQARIREGRERDEAFGRQRCVEASSAALGLLAAAEAAAKKEGNAHE